jgi:hypothetical protein
MTPAPVPLGGSDYYVARHDDFKRRHPDLPAPTYYLAYGSAYADRFVNRTCARLTPDGQAWLLRTCRKLQESIEAERAEDPSRFARLERDDAAFKRFAYGSHARAYLEAGVLDLSARDLYEIAATPDLRDTLSRDGVALILALARAMTRRLAMGVAHRRTGIFGYPIVPALRT